MHTNEAVSMEHTLKWLRVLAIVIIVSLVNSLISMLPFVPLVLTNLISYGVMAATVFALFQLASANERYKKAGIFRTVALACSLISVVLVSFSLLSLATAVFSTIAVYQEYYGHSELVKGNARLSGKWRKLFVWMLLSGLLIGFGTVTAAVILAMAQVDTVKIVNLVAALLGIPRLIVDVVYLQYLKKTIGYLKS